MVQLIYLFIVSILVGVIIFRLKIFEKIIDIAFFLLIYSVLELLYVYDILSKILASITAFVFSVILRRIVVKKLVS